MRVLVDANVLFPTVLRGLVTGCAARGLVVPFWSARILEEWARAAGRDSPAADAQARGEIALLRARFPQAEVVVPEGAAARLWLPDQADVHVLAAAIAAGCGVILTQNTKDFPRRVLASHGITRLSADELLLSLPRDEVAAVAQDELAKLREASGEDWTLRQMLRKAGVPRLARVQG
ncbi:MAG: PIN domain-containing protein [Rubellimicrobium sp.]|nr:PIN domain-containing protein [Rubellimicrobium sp.]